MTTFKIIGAPAVGNKSLCDSCDYGQVVTGHSIGQKITWCGANFGSKDKIKLDFPVASCTEYWPRGALRINAFGDWAEKFLIHVDNAGKSNKAGFDKE